MGALVKTYLEFDVQIFPTRPGGKIQKLAVWLVNDRYTFPFQTLISFFCVENVSRFSRTP